MTAEQERQALAPFLERARTGGILVVGQVKTELEARLGRPIALSSVYNLLHRHGWRKLAPDKRHPQSDPLAQAEWKKNSPSGSQKSARSGPGKVRSG
jgi:transposase